MLGPVPIKEKSNSKNNVTEEDNEHDKIKFVQNEQERELFKARRGGMKVPEKKIFPS